MGARGTEVKASISSRTGMLEAAGAGEAAKTALEKGAKAARGAGAGVAKASISSRAENLRAIIARDN